jgi:hypothetical protein
VAEIQKDIPEHEGRYKATSDGRIYSCLTSKFMSIYVNKSNGYCYVNLTLKSGKQKNCIVHRLIASAFFGECSDGYQVNHKNGIRDDNRIDNLEYLTKIENERHSWRFLNRKPSINRGEEAGSAKLTEKKVLQMRHLHATGKYTYKELGKRFGISGGHTSKVINGDAWSHI